MQDKVERHSRPDDTVVSGFRETDNYLEKSAAVQLP
jgi:hypothetical protein